MKKLLLLLFLIPNLVMGEFDTQGALDAGYKQEEIDMYLLAPSCVDMYGFKFWYIKIDIYAKFHELKKLGYTKKEIKKSLNSLCENAKKIHESKEEEDRKKEWRSQCASLSGKAKSDFAAKKIYETCLEEGGYEK
jgi:arsenate reductase-like glutaredoxin family protein